MSKLVKPLPSPNKNIDRLLEDMLRDAATDIPLDVKVKVISVAINWEKVKYHIADAGDNGLDPSIFGDSVGEK